MANKWDYLGYIDDTNVDYSDQIKKAADAGDYKTAAILEQQRNNKIRSKGMDYEETNDYLSYLDEPQQTVSSFQSNGEADKTLSRIQNSSYDSFKQGDAYRDLYNTYERNGQLAMNDTLASTSARTGGLASSYAQQAAQQTYNSYLKQAEDAAYSRYNDELNKLYSLYEAQLGKENTEYNRYIDDRNYNYQLSRDNYNDTQDAINRAYQYSTDAYNRGVQAEQTAYDRDQDAKKWQYQYETDEYNRGQDALDREQAMTQWNYSVGQDDRANALAAANVQAAGGNYKGLADYYGVDEETAKAYYASQNGTATDAQQTAAMMEAAGGNYKPLADIFGVSESAAKSWYQQEYGTKSSYSGGSPSSESSKSSGTETTNPYEGLSESAVVSSLLSEYNKKGTLTPEQFSTLESMGYYLNPTTGTIEDRTTLLESGDNKYATHQNTLDSLKTAIGNAQGNKQAIANAILIYYLDGEISDDEAVYYAKANGVDLGI